MAEIHVTTRTGEAITLAAKPGLSVMEIICDGGIDELLALCGGCCSCATCHVFIRDGAERLSDMAGDECDMLDGSLFRDAVSRLSCQVPVTSALDGLVVEIAPEE